MKEIIIEHLISYNIQYTDYDGHIGIPHNCTMDATVIHDLLPLGIKGMNARLDTDGKPYIAIHY